MTDIEKLKEIKETLLLSNRCYTYGAFPKAKQNIEKAITELDKVIENGTQGTDKKCQ